MSEQQTNEYGFDCPACGHRHQGRRFAYICIGCPCTHNEQSKGEPTPPATPPNCPKCGSPDRDRHPMTGRDDSEVRVCQQAAVDRLLSALPVEGDMPHVCQWREIATAPKDGTQILVSNGAAVMAARWLDGAWYEVNNDPSDVWGHPWWGHETTHWMPLPAPPVALVPAEGDR